MGQYTGKKYRPSNGTEGDGFMENFCYQCIHDNPDYNARSPRCEIMTLTMCLGVDDNDYPSEWQYDENDRPTCTKWKKWDWGNDGNPDDPENPKFIPPDDPNQLCLPFELEKIELQQLQIAE